MDGKYFTLNELIKDRTTNPQWLANAENLLPLLDAIREEFGEPIVITSGYRSPGKNQDCNGSKTSQHLTAEAADMQPGSGSKKTKKQLFDAALKVGMAYGFDQLIWEHPGGCWVHISLVNTNWKNNPRKRQRREILTCYDPNMKKYNLVTDLAHTRFV